MDRSAAIITLIVTAGSLISMLLIILSAVVSSQVLAVLYGHSIAGKRDQWPAPEDTSLSYLILSYILHTPG